MDRELDRVMGVISSLPSAVDKFGRAFRMAFDEVIDPRSGRYSLDQLAKTEKTYLGTKVEIVVQAALAFDPGIDLDYRIADVDVDAKFSIYRWRWMIPTEAVDRLCLLMHADDATSTFSVGVIRASRDKLTAPNKDKKRGIRASARPSIRWLIEDGPLPRNFILGLDPKIRDQVLQPPGPRYGQERINRLLRLVHDTVIPRTAIETVAQQLDPMKRVRDARKALEGEGIFVLGGQESAHKKHAKAVGLPIPKKGETVSTMRRP